MEIDYPKNPDELTFSAILIYELDKVAIKPFSFSKFSFKIMDLFEGFIVGKESIVIKISCYDLEYLMPAVYTFKVSVNLPPSNGKFIIEPLEGVAITTVFKLTSQDFIGYYNYFYF